MNRQQQLKVIADEIERCPLCRQGGTGKAVPGEGTGAARVMFIGEAPGRTEAGTGRPFVGRSGQFLRKFITDAGLDENEVFFTSPVHYLPLCGTPTTAMIEHGRTHLEKQIRALEPLIVVLLGNVASRALLGRNPNMAIEHGTTFEKNNITFFITVHPAYANRFPNGKKKFIEDFAKLKQLIKKAAAA